MEFFRGCLAQYVGVLDSPWSNVAESIESLYHDSVKTDKGIEEVIKTLDVKLSEAIMHAMENGPELEKKVSTFVFLFIQNDTTKNLSPYFLVQFNLLHWSVKHFLRTNGVNSFYFVQ